MTQPAAVLIPQIARTLGQFLVWIDKAEAYAETRGFPADVLLTARLQPDMFPLVRQLGSACDTAKLSVSRLTGKAAPKHSDDQVTFAEVRARVTDVLAWLEAAKDEAYAGADDARVSFPWYPGKELTGPDYMLQFALPNFYFHASMAYAILRHNGVPLGKSDFMGALPWSDVA